MSRAYVGEVSIGKKASGERVRIWLVPFRELDNQRVLGQHRRLHAIYAIVYAHGRRWMRWEQAQHHDEFRDLHRQILWEAMHRGFPSGDPEVHQTPVPEVNRPDVPQFPYPRPTAVVQQERWQLWTRWQGKWQGRDEMPPAYAEVAAQYESQGGCLHVNWTESLGRNDAGERIELCLDCKQYIRIGKGLWVPK